MAWLMASLAVAEKEQVNPEEILIYYGASENLEALKTVHDDKMLRGEMLWVMKHLLEEIRRLDDLDMRKELAELDPKTIIHYYERSKKLAEEVRSQPAFRRKIRNVINTKSIYSLRQKLHYQKILGANRDQHELLKNVPTDFVTGRVTTEFLSDHLLIAFMPLFTTERSEFTIDLMDQLGVNESNISWSGKPHINDVWLNVIAHFFVAGGQKTMAFTKPENVIQEAGGKQAPIYEPIEQYVNKTKPKVHGEMTYYLKQLSYVFSGGKPDNLGNIMWRLYVARLRSIQMTFSLFVGLRMLMTTQSPSDAAMAFVLYHFAGIWMFGWPWDIISGGARLTENELAENKERVERLKLTFSKVVKGSYTDEKSMEKEYKAAIFETAQLYLSKGKLNVANSTLKKRFLDTLIETNPRLFLSKKASEESDTLALLEREPRAFLNMQSVFDRADFKKDFSFNQQNMNMVDHDREDMQVVAGKLRVLLAEFPPLPNQINKTGNFLFAGVFGAALSTYLAIILIIWTFSPEYITWKNIGLWAAGNYSAYGLLYFLYSKGIKGHWESLKHWTNYFHKRFLNKKNTECEGGF